MTTRDTLKTYFRKGAIPKASEFVELIDQVLIQNDDNLFQAANGPLGIKATAEGNLLNFYDDKKEQLTWQLKQKEGDTAGLSLRSGEQSRLFIDNTGNIGVGTTETSKAKLTVTGDTTLNGRVDVTNTLTVKGANTNTKLEGPLTVDGLLAAGKGATITGEAAIGNLKITTHGNIGTGMIKSYGTNVTGDDETVFQTQLQVGDQIIVGDQMRTITDITDQKLLKISRAFDSDLSTSTSFRFSRPALLVQNGNVGLGTVNPRVRLEVVAQSNSGGSTGLSAPETVLRLRRDGIRGETSHNVVDFNIDRYVKDGTNAKTRLSLRLTDGATDRTSPIMTLRSDGAVGIGTTNPQGQLDIIAPNQPVDDYIVSAGTSIKGGKGKFLSLYVGDQIIVGGQSRRIMAIIDATTLTIDAPFNSDITSPVPLTVSPVFRVQDGRLVQTPWIGVTVFSNEWENRGGGYSTTAYFKDSLGIVHLKGFVKNGAFSWTGSSFRQDVTIFTLPIGFRPLEQETHVVATHGGGNTPDALVTVDILTNGRVVPNTGNNFWLSLNGITFRAA